MKKESGLSGEYLAWLQAHLSRRGEDSLEKAYDIGRRALAGKHSLLGLVAVHHRGLGLATSKPATPRRRAAVIKVAGEFLKESLSTFEMTYRGYKEAHDSLRRSFQREKKIAAELAQSEMALQEKTRFLEATLAGMDEGVIVVDAEGRLLLANDAAKRMLGRKALRPQARWFERAEKFGLEVFQDGRSLPIEEWPLAKAVQGVTVQDSVYFVKFRRRIPGLWLSVSARPLDSQGEGPAGGMVVFRDVTDKIKAKDMERARDLAEAANRAKSVFLASVSHELRTPLNSIIGFAGLLQKGPQGGAKPEERDAFTRRILDNSKHLLGLINQILDLTKIEAKRTDFKPTTVNLAQLIRETLEQLEVEAKLKGLWLRAHIPTDPLDFVTDALQMKQVLINLVGNAVKFTDFGGVDVRVLADSQSGRPLAVEVSDTGIGIPSDKLDMIFGAFQQVDQGPSRRYPGTGLGLSIAKSYLEQMGHRIEVESRLGKGSTFRVRFGPPPVSTGGLIGS